MELKINTEIRNYTESIFFGLSTRQFIFSAAACTLAAFIYLTFDDVFKFIILLGNVFTLPLLESITL